MPDLSTPEGRAEMLKALYDWGMFVPTIFLLGPVGDEPAHLEGRFCLNDEAVEAVIGKWWKQQ